MRIETRWLPSPRARVFVEVGDRIALADEGLDIVGEPQQMSESGVLEWVDVPAVRCAHWAIMDDEGVAAYTDDWHHGPLRAGATVTITVPGIAPPLCRLDDDGVQ